MGAAATCKSREGNAEKLRCLRYDIEMGWLYDKAGCHGESLYEG